MRKRLITPTPQAGTPRDEGWLDLGRLAVVEVTSEDKDYPVESALVSGGTLGWRAAESGTQTVRLIFDEPQRLARIALVFEEAETERTQEFVLRWSGDGGRSFREIVRQQWNFSPPTHKTYAAIAFLFLDEALGEYDIETRVGQVNVDSISKGPAQSYSLEALPKAVDALFAHKQ